MKRITSLLLAIIAFSLLSIQSCKKNTETSPFFEDTITKVIISKNGIAAISTKNGQHYTQNVLLDTSYSSDKTIRIMSIPLSGIKFSQKNIISKRPSPGNAVMVGGDDGGGNTTTTSWIVTGTLYGGCCYADVTVSPSVQYIDDYAVRATVVDVYTIGRTVHYSINYVYTRNGSSFYSTQTEYTMYF